jgi:hypothetical protein
VLMACSWTAAKKVLIRVGSKAHTVTLRRRSMLEPW